MVLFLNPVYCYFTTSKEIEKLFNNSYENIPNTDLRTPLLRYLNKFIRRYQFHKIPSITPEFRRECLIKKLTHFKKDILKKVIYFNPDTQKKELSFLSRNNKFKLLSELYDIELKLFILKERNPCRLKRGRFQFPSSLKVESFDITELYIDDYHSLGSEWKTISDEECLYYYKLEFQSKIDILTMHQKGVKEAKDFLRDKYLHPTLFKQQFSHYLTEEQQKRLKRYSDYSLYIQFIDNTMAVDNLKFYMFLADSYESCVKNLFKTFK